MKSFGKQRRHPGPEGGAVYSEVNLGAAGSTLMSAVIGPEGKANKKRDKGKSGPAAADAEVYSEIRSLPALRDNAAM
ncbi:hypothetical protein CHARACLAT_027615 [Characodon lateralis]|uniref:Uncharacterized protein n=1 Tax=Characodon lateralis TaxID=208331 RepID=A0ABU7CSG9_9TELE|nr:hypothetical protein [Characodon lateralis]